MCSIRVGMQPLWQTTVPLPPSHLLYNFNMHISTYFTVKEMNLASPYINDEIPLQSMFYLLPSKMNKKNLTNPRFLRTSATHVGNTHKIRDRLLWSSLLWHSVPSEEPCLDLDTALCKSTNTSILLSSASRLCKIKLWKQPICFWAMQKTKPLILSKFMNQLLYWSILTYLAVLLEILTALLEYFNFCVCLSCTTVVVHNRDRPCFF